MTASAETANPSATARSTRRAYLLLALALIAFAIYSSLLPFELSPSPLARAWQRFLNDLLMSAVGQPSRTDVIANTLLFVPVAFALSGALVAGRTDRGIWRAGFVLPISIAVSVSAEFLQTFVSQRIPSSFDIGAQTVGAAFGIAAWLLMGEPLTAWIRETRTVRTEDRFARLLLAYGAGWVLVNLAPFDITVDVGELAQRYRSGQIALMPFVDGLASWRARWDALAESISAAPIGALALLGFDGGRQPAIRAIAVGLCAVGAVEVAQVFIVSHAAASDDAIFGGIGIIVGVVAATRFAVRGAAMVEARTGSISWGAAALVGIWCLVLAGYHWLPYDFGVDEEAMRTKLASISLLPFAAYGAGSYLNALNDLLTKLALATPLGFTGAFVSGMEMKMFRRVAAFAAVGAAVVFGILEAGQFFLPSRIPDTTDVMVGIAGTLLGLRVAYWLRVPANPAAPMSAAGR